MRGERTYTFTVDDDGVVKLNMPQFRSGDLMAIAIAVLRNIKRGMADDPEISKTFEVALPMLEAALKVKQ